MRGSLTGNFVRKTGDTITGTLRISTAAGVIPLELARSDDNTDLMRLITAGVERYRLLAGSASPGARIRSPGLANVVGWDIAGAKQVVGSVPLARLSRANATEDASVDLVITKAGPRVVLNESAAAALQLLLVSQLTGTALAAYGYDQVNHEWVLRDIPGGTSRVRISRSDGKMLAGFVPLSRQTRDEVSAQNAAQVTVTGALTTIVDAPTLFPEVNDKIFVFAQAQLDKGAAAGQSFIEVAQAGTATVATLDNRTSVIQKDSNVPANGSVILSLSALFRVTGAGNFIARLRGASVGSDSTVPAGSGQIYVLVLLGA